MDEQCLVKREVGHGLLRLSTEHSVLIVQLPKDETGFVLTLGHLAQAFEEITKGVIESEYVEECFHEALALVRERTEVYTEKQILDGLDTK